MAAAIEKLGSRTTTDNEAHERIYIVEGTDDHDLAMTTLKAAAPTSVGSLVRQNPSIEPLEDGYTWVGVVPYARGDSSAWTFDTTGGTKHITQSLATVNSYAAAGTATDHMGAIGVANGRAEGCDIVVPVYRWSETHTFDESDVDYAYKGIIRGLTGKTNNAGFKGCAAGECLFLGASGGLRNDGSEKVDITFRFAASPNLTGLQVGDITGIAKGGWEYLWVEYQPVEDATAKGIALRPRFVYVERVYEEGSFAGLDIGT